MVGPSTLVCFALRTSGREGERGAVLPSQKIVIFEVFLRIPTWGLVAEVTMKTLDGFPGGLDIIRHR